MNARIEGSTPSAASATYLDADAARELLRELDDVLAQHFAGASYAEIAATIGVEEDLAYEVVRHALRDRYERV